MKVKEVSLHIGRGEEQEEKDEKEEVEEEEEAEEDRWVLLFSFIRLVFLKRFLLHFSIRVCL